MRATLEGLPPELRSLIWSAVGEQESFDSLMMASQLIRHDILRGIPGALLSCECPYNHPCRCGKGFEIDRLVIIVDGLCSERYWLKFYIYRKQKSTPSVWCIADLDAPLAQVLRYYRPRETILEFRSPNRKPNNESGQYYMVLRAKLFDICEILGWFQPQRERRSRIHFSDSWPPEGYPPRSFWDTQVMLGDVGKRNPELCNEQALRFAFIDPDLWPYEKRPVIYETLLMPLILNPDWRNSEVTFGQGRRQASTFNYRQRRHWQLVKSESFDYKLLGVTAWAYIGRLITDGSVKLGDNDLTPYYERYENNVETWSAEKARRPLLQAAFHSSLLAMIDFGLMFDILLARASCDIIDGHLLEPLRSHIRRNRNLSPANAFSKDHPNTEAVDWPWNLEPIRQAYILWAEKDAGEIQFEWPGKKEGVLGRWAISGFRYGFRYLEPLEQWMLEDSAKLRFLRWRQAHTPLWPRSWARNWPPLKKKEIIYDDIMRRRLGIGSDL
ncbi:hypothetical protein F5Y10DRAFT_285423 [Nemania abortiva]|nr:hypothetical protein F5Y10DRAFT_285423 [Nemania abortiva]